MNASVNVRLSRADKRLMVVAVVMLAIALIIFFGAAILAIINTPYWMQGFVNFMHNPWTTGFGLILVLVAWIIMVGVAGKR